MRDASRVPVGAPAGRFEPAAVRRSLAALIRVRLTRRADCLWGWFRSHGISRLKVQFPISIGACLIGVSLELGDWDLELPLESFPLIPTYSHIKRGGRGCRAHASSRPKSVFARPVPFRLELCGWNFSGAWILGFGALLQAPCHQPHPQPVVANCR
jgi:hypothetical protein